MTRNWGVTSGLDSQRHPARPYSAHDTQRDSFPGGPAFERSNILQALIDVIAVIFGIVFLLLCTGILSLGFYWLLISIVG